jgi:hypothetical protein
MGMETNNDDLLLKQFFDEQRHDIPDNGFSRRVMRRLPSRHHPVLSALNTLCIVLCVFLFIFLGGIQYLIEMLRDMFVYFLQHGPVYVDWRTLFVLIGLGAIFGLYKMYRSFDY